jgi:hypothetical protein
VVRDSDMSSSSGGKKSPPDLGKKSPPEDDKKSSTAAAGEKNIPPATDAGKSQKQTQDGDKKSPTLAVAAGKKTPSDGTGKAKKISHDLGKKSPQDDNPMDAMSTVSSQSSTAAMAGASRILEMCRKGEWVALDQTLRALEKGCQELVAEEVGHTFFLNLQTSTSISMSNGISRIFESGSFSQHIFTIDFKDFFRLANYHMANFKVLFQKGRSIPPSNTHDVLQHSVGPCHETAYNILLFLEFN